MKEVVRSGTFDRVKKPSVPVVVVIPPAVTLTPATPVLPAFTTFPRIVERFVLPGFGFGFGLPPLLLPPPQPESRTIPLNERAEKN